MRLLRHRLLQRLVALLLVAGVGASAVPTASASAPSGAHGLDARAVEAARGAARQAPTRGAAADAFVATYVRLTGDSGAAEALYRLLLGDAIGGVPPAVPPAAVVSAAPATAPGSSSAGVLVAASRLDARCAPTVRPPAPRVAARPAAALCAARARAP